MTIRSKSPAPPADARGYHHGDLRAAMIATAEELLHERGVDGFTLRECARRAGVSPSAPAHHFGNMAGLLEAIAAAAFDALYDDIQRSVAEAPDLATRLIALAKAYIRFALQRPGRFRVTFQGSMRPVEAKDPCLTAAATRVFDLVTAEVEAIVGTSPALAETVFLWSFVHGMANLLLDRRLAFLEGTSEADIEDPASLPAQSIALLGKWVNSQLAARARTA